MTTTTTTTTTIPHQDLLISYNLSSASIESLKPTDEAEYWKRKLIQLLLLEPAYVFPNDDHSVRGFYDTVTSDKIYVHGKEQRPGQRGIRSGKYALAGSLIMKINPLAAYYYDRAKQPDFVIKFEDALQPYLNNNVKSLLVGGDRGVVYLALRVLFCYLYDVEFRMKVGNLCTHQREIRLDVEKRHLVEPIKKVIVNTLRDFLGAHDIGVSLYKKNLIKVCKKSWKFVDDVIAIVFINYFNLFNAKKQGLGYCLDPDFALINHSCLPNCTQFTSTSTNEFQVINTLPIFEDEEITVTYIPLGFPKEIRSYQLSLQFYFHCQCKLCKFDDNNDPFFSIQCNKCGTRIKSPSFKLILTSPNLAMRQHVCTKCLNNLNQVVYPKNIKIRNFFMSLILFFKSVTGLSFNDQDYFKFLNKEFVKYIEKFTLVELIKMLVNGIYQFEIPKMRRNLLKNLVEIVVSDKVFPLHTFPFNVIIRELDNMESQRELVISLLDGISRLQLKLQRVFGVDIPSDLTSMLTFDNCLFLDVAELLYQIVKFIINPDNENRSRQISTVFGADTLATFCHCCFFFFKQVRSSSEVDSIEDRLVEVMDLYDTLGLNDKLTIGRCLSDLFDLAELYIRVTESQIAVKSAIGFLIYFPIDKDDCL
ncbi:hypothetical protein Cantr_07577 [Candida viswanathii]|uniref:SET domain-containing protein n=1 Tax=Candida viswanathii TaxID=5486 RepID=A0A367XZ62_9ASCO|nr:hypothetical protein Cantr_07577 [Candida viswanathii]